MAAALLVLSFILNMASLICFVMLLIAAAEDEVWKAIVGFIFFPYLAWAIVEYYDEGKWARITTWLVGGVLANILLVAYLYARLPAR